MKTGTFSQLSKNKKVVGIIEFEGRILIACEDELYVMKNGVAEPLQLEYEDQPKEQ